MPNITELLHIDPREVVGLVGSGAMTRAALNLAAEMLGAGRGVVSTSTVNMSDLNLPQPSFFLVEPDLPVAVARLPGLIREYRHVRLAREHLRPDKIRGIDPSWVAEIRDIRGVDNIIVEADGARRRALKAPNNDEPLPPPGVDLVFVCAGLEALGKPLDDVSTHRPELASEIMGIRLGETITEYAMSRLLASPRGGLKGVPREARTYFLLTGWERGEHGRSEQAAQSVAHIALRLAPSMRGVVYMGVGHTGFTGAEMVLGSRSDTLSQSEGPSN